MSGEFAGFDHVGGTLEEGDGGNLENEGESDKNE